MVSVWERETALRTGFWGFLVLFCWRFLLGDPNRAPHVALLNRLPHDVRRVPRIVKCFIALFATVAAAAEATAACGWPTNEA